MPSARLVVSSEADCLHLKIEHIRTGASHIRVRAERPRSKLLSLYKSALDALTPSIPVASGWLARDAHARFDTFVHPALNPRFSLAQEIPT